MKITTFAYVSLLASLPAWAAGFDCNSVAPASQGQPNQYRVEKFTNYTPRGGQSKGNDATGGKCGQSASGLDPCEYYMEWQAQGTVQFSVTAVPQQGEAANLFGGVYRVESLSQVAGGSKGCVLVLAADRYAGAAEAAKYGVVNGDGVNKMDFVTQESHGDMAKKINEAKGGNLVLVGTGGFRNGDKPDPAKIKRELGI